MSAIELTLTEITIVRVAMAAHRESLRAMQREARDGGACSVAEHHSKRISALLSLDEKFSEAGIEAKANEKGGAR